MAEQSHSSYIGSYRRPAQEVHFEVTRELTAGDLVVRAATGVGSKSPGIKALRATHHKLAQVIASGFSDAEASLATGYSPSRISILKSDPAFAELLTHYGTKRDEVFVNVTERMAGFATDALEELHDRLLNNPGEFKVKDLNEVIKTTADRGGYSPVQKTENKTIVLTAGELANLKAEVANRQNGQVRKINQVEEATRVKGYLQGQADKSLSGSEESQIGSNDNRPTGDILIEATASGLQSQGDDLREACWEEIEELDTIGGAPREVIPIPVV